MNIHEYQAKALFHKFGLPVSPGIVFDQDSLSLEKIASLRTERFAVKAQVHAGGRGKAGGIQVVKTAGEAFQAARQMLGTKLATFQTQGEGKPIDRVLIETAGMIEKEFYLAVTLDRSKALPCVIFSEAGGVEIEEMAHKAPERILKFWFDPDEALTPELFQPWLSASKSKLSKELQTPQRQIRLADVIARLAQVFVSLDAALVEINPLALMADGTLLAVDAKINFDDNAIFRHPEIAALRDPRQEDSREVEAKKYDLSYVGLEGNIGCMVNGAGLAMATMDIVKWVGGEPANFLDVGGGASKEKVTAAFKIILQDPRVKTIFVNIFGGIMRCDIIAEGILAAVKEMDLKVPLVVRLEGTNVKEGKTILARSGLPIISADGFLDGAKKAVEAIR